MPDGSLQEVAPPRLAQTKPDLSLCFPATQLAVRRALSTVRAAMRVHDLDQTTLGTLELVLAEACNNIVKHAYAGKSGEAITLIAKYEAGLIRIELADQGAQMPGLAPPEKKRGGPITSVNDLPEGGFGWDLIRCLTRSLAYRRLGNRNVLRLAIEVTPARRHDQRHRF